jgi:hypothetical protein
LLPQRDLQRDDVHAMAAAPMSEEQHAAEGLRQEAQELLDRWYPGTALAVDWTGEVYVLQVARGYRLAPAIWVRPEHLANPEARIRVHRELVAAAWQLFTSRLS